MGVIYKLKDEVVSFIISQRQSNPLSSCRQLAESASQKFGLQLSKSSVHDVLKESGIITPRGRKPKDKFEIPQEKKKQIQVSLSEVKLLPASIEAAPEPMPELKAESAPEGAAEPKISLIPDVAEPEPKIILPEPVIQPDPVILSGPPASVAGAKDLEDTVEVSAEHEGAGKIFLKAALWDLGVFSEEDIKATDWEYYLTYSKGIRVILENNKDFFIDLALPIERCIRETADGLINNIKPLMVDKVSDKDLFKASMEAQVGFKIKNVSIVGKNDHILLEISDIMEFIRSFTYIPILFVESKEKDMLKRAGSIFFPQIIENNSLMENILNLKGFDSKNKREIVITLIINDGYENGAVLQEAVDKLNGMFLRDEQNRLVKIKIFPSRG